MIIKTLNGAGSVRASAVAVVAACLLSSLGCADSPFDASVKGTITLDGEPVEPGVVIFSPGVRGSGSSRGRIERGGAYELVTRNAVGIDPGFYRVSVRVFEKGDPPGPGERQVADLPPLVPERYLSPDTSGLEFEVKPGSNRIDIELSSAENES